MAFSSFKIFNFTIQNPGRPGWHRKSLKDPGRHWKTLEDTGRPWKTVEDTGSPGRHWKTWKTQVRMWVFRKPFYFFFLMHTQWLYFG
jgi:hypothetical protein